MHGRLQLAAAREAAVPVVDPEEGVALVRLRRGHVVAAAARPLLLQQQVPQRAEVGDDRDAVLLLVAPALHAVPRRGRAQGAVVEVLVR